MDWLEKVPEFLKMSWSEISKVMIGVFLTGFLSYGWVRQVRRHARDRVNAAKEQAKFEAAAAREQARLEVESARAHARADVESAKAEVSQKVADQATQHAADMGALQRAMTDVRACEMKASAERDDYAKQQAALKTRLADLEAFDGKLWDRPLLDAPPRFVPAADRRTRFVAVANLKGGVGKTTVAANAGALLAKRGKRVLLVDLDFQGSLTRLCIDFKSLRDVVKKGETVSALLGLNDGPAGDWLARVIRPVTGFATSPGPDTLPGVLGTDRTGGALDFIPAFDDLADVELREEVRWFVTRRADVRFLFRRLLHVPAIFDRYDYVFFDCPPRLTTSSVNALACADGLIIPATLDQQSVQGVPRTLGWLQRLQHVSHARLWGLVANQVKYFNGRPTQWSKDALTALPDYIRRAGHDVRHAFVTVVRSDAATIARQTGDGRIPALADDADPLFIDLVNHIEKGANL